MAIVLSGKDLASRKRAEMTLEVENLYKKYGKKPHLAVILVGEDPGSVSYVAGKEKACIEVGLENTTIRKESSITEAELLGIIDDLNNDDSINGILVQLPLPKHINADKVINAIVPHKDVDGFHPVNVASLYLKQPGIIPCHRVVTRNGEVAKSFAFGGENVQRELLENEGIEFKNDGTIDLKKYGWFGWIYCKNMLKF